MNRLMGVAGALLFVALAALANYMTSRIGMIDLPFSTAVTAGTFAAGAVLIARDHVHDTLGRWAVLACIVAGAVVSVLTSPALIALASGVAFLLAEAIDWAVYSPMRQRGWGRAVLLSSLIAAPLDTLIFLWIAPFPATLGAVTGQWGVKVALAGLAVLLVKVIQRAVLRDRIQPTDA